MAMKFPVGGSGGDFKRMPAGSHLGICNLIVDVGLQPGSGQYPKPKHQIYVRWEVPSERVEYEKDGKKVEGPLTIGKFYTASMNEKAALRKDLESWRGKGFSDEEAANFDVAGILGKACLLSVVESESGGKTYSNIASISGVPKGMPIPKPENELLYYDPDNLKAWDKLPKWLKDKIEKQIVPTLEHDEDRYEPAHAGDIPGFD